MIPISDDFGQTIQGLHLDGDTINALDQHIAVFGKDFTAGTYEYLKIDPTTGGLWIADGGGSITVDGSVTVSGTATVTTNFEYAEDTGHTTGDVGALTLAVRNDAATALAGTTLDYIPLTTDANGFLYVNVKTGIFRCSR